MAHDGDLLKSQKGNLIPNNATQLYDLQHRPSNRSMGSGGPIGGYISNLKGVKFENKSSS